MTVIAPTATSPPYRARLELKLMESRLSVESMTKGGDAQRYDGQDGLLFRLQVLFFAA